MFRMLCEPDIFCAYAQCQVGTGRIRVSHVQVLHTETSLQL